MMHKLRLHNLGLLSSVMILQGFFPKKMLNISKKILPSLLKISCSIVIQSILVSSSISLYK